MHVGLYYAKNYQKLLHKNNYLTSRANILSPLYWFNILLILTQKIIYKIVRKFFLINISFFMTLSLICMKYYPFAPISYMDRKAKEALNHSREVFRFVLWFLSSSLFATWPTRDWTPWALSSNSRELVHISLYKQAINLRLYLLLFSFMSTCLFAEIRTVVK